MSAALGSDWLEKLIVADEPSVIGPLLDSVAVGATFATLTLCVAVLLWSVPSVTLTETLGFEGPSGKLQSKVPPATVGEPTRLPPVPHVGKPDTKLSESPSASVAVNVYVFV